MPVERQRGIGVAVAMGAGCVTRGNEGLVRFVQTSPLAARELLYPRIRGDTRQGGELIRVAGQALDDPERVELFAGRESELHAGGICRRPVGQHGLTRAVERRLRQARAGQGAARLEVAGRLAGVEDASEAPGGILVAVIPVRDLHPGRETLEDVVDLCAPDVLAQRSPKPLA